MTESIPTTRHDERPRAIFEITQIEKVLADLIVAESWELTARRFAARSTVGVRNRA